MRIFVAGAAGAIGRRLLPMLIVAGHEVTGTTRSIERASTIALTGAKVAVVDALDTDALLDAVAESRAQVVIHQLTDLTVLPGETLGEIEIARNARLRTLGTANLVDAAAACGAVRVIAQSLAWLYPPGPEPHAESDTLETPGDEPSMTLSAVMSMERVVTTDDRFEGVVLRLGRLYGPGTWTDHPLEAPTVHVDAAAWATLLAVEVAGTAVYNIADDGGPVAITRAREDLGWMPEFRAPD